ncbi:hypothetical protein KAJ83_10365 [Marivibrio halodurans]|uniref:Uncharacterized protein n=1 Tax=Marivibrio halodurans TaxID=2039722 RepID=A0A8J7V2Q7_9PROT|nr:hypothetical protein [Marivibrio halodurans]MBP5857411.1 hypothetical protein [Marivibrio halodurans]
MPTDTYVKISQETRDELKTLRQLTGTGAVKLLNGAAPVPAGLNAGIVSNWLCGAAGKARKTHLDFVLNAWRALPRMHVVEIDETMRARLATLRAQTGAGPTKLLKAMQQVPDGLTAPAVSRWLSGASKTAPKDHLRAVIAAWEALPRYEFFAITAKQQRALRALIEETGAGPSALLRGQRGLCPEGLNSSTIGNWLRKPGHRVRKDHLDYVMGRLESLREQAAGYFTLTPTDRAALRDEITRTGVSAFKLLKHADDAPRGLSSAALRRWIDGQTKTVRRDHYDYALSRWRDLPDLQGPHLAKLGLGDCETRHGRIVFNDEITSRLHSLQERTGMGGTALISWASRAGLDIPAGLTDTMIAQWINGVTRSAKPRHLAFAITAWQRAMEESGARCLITGDMRERLLSFQDAYLLPSGVFAMVDHAPKGLGPDTVRRWLESGPRYADPDHVNWVLETCDGLLEAERFRVPVTPDIQARLMAAREKCEIGATDLLRHAPDPPDGLTANMISAWINGSVNTARKDHLDWVLARWTEHVEA